MADKALDYILQYRSTYTRAAITEQLLRGGLDSATIEAAWAQADATPGQPAPQLPPQAPAPVTIQPYAPQGPQQPARPIYDTKGHLINGNDPAVQQIVQVRRARNVAFGIYTVLSVATLYVIAAASLDVTLTLAGVMGVALLIAVIVALARRTTNPGLTRGITQAIAICAVLTVGYYSLIMAVVGICIGGTVL